VYRITIDIDGDDALGTKEAVAMRLEPLGKVRVVSVSDGKDKLSGKEAVKNNVG